MSIVKRRAIDAHMHVCQWFLDSGETSFNVLERYQKDNCLEAVDIMCCSNNANLWNGYEMDQNILAAIVKMEYPNTYIHGCMYIPDTEKITREFSFENQLETLMEMGFDGIKFCEFKPDSYKVHKMDKRMEELEKYFSYCEKHQIPMCWHVADPETFWDESKVPEAAKKSGWFYGDGSFPTYESLYDQTVGILDRHPNINVVLAHAFFMSFAPDKMQAIFEKYPNVKMDLAPGWEMFDGFRKYYEEWSGLFRRYSDRILFATDATMSSGIQSVDLLADRVLRFLTTDETFEVPGNHTAHGIKLEEEHLDNILCQNFKRVVGAKPHTLQRSSLKKYMEHFLPLIPASKNRAMISEYYRKHF